MRLLLAALIALAPVARVAAQGLDPSVLFNPPRDSWPTYHGDYSGQRHSKLTQITPANVQQMTLAWAFQTGQRSRSKRHPSSSTASFTSPHQTTCGR